MDQTTALVIGGALVALVIIAFLVRSRLKKISFTIGKLFKGQVEAGAAPGGGAKGAVVKKVAVDGSDNDIGAKGAGAELSQTKVKGDGNTVKAEN
jgi:hypothetical protein